MRALHSAARLLPLRSLIVLAAAAFLTAPAQAVTINLADGGGGGGGYGNSVVFAEGGITLTASAWAETGDETAAGSGLYLFQTAEIWSWGSGLAICNRAEGLAWGDCDNSDEHEIDTVGRDDLVVLVFDQRVTFESLVVDPHDGPGDDPRDRDITYWIGDVAALPDLAGHSFGSLASLPGFSAGTLSAISPDFEPFSHELSGSGNVLLLSGDFAARECTAQGIGGDTECEAYKLSGISVAPVPLPPAAGLLATAFLAVAGYRRRR